MPYIKVRKQSDGSTRYTAIVRLRRGKTIVHQEARTFAHRSAAVSWAKHREVALEGPGALTRVQQGAPTIAELIRWYIDNFETVSKWQRSKQAHLEFLERHALGHLNCFVESFNGSFRDECLNVHWFETIEDATAKIEAWRVEYNESRPHEALKELRRANTP